MDAMGSAAGGRTVGSRRGDEGPGVDRLDDGALSTADKGVMLI